MADEKEQQLREKIASQEMAMSQLPSLGSIAQITGPYSPEAKERAQQIKELVESEKELELLLESRRVAAVIRLQDELHPPINSEDCPICLETIKHVNSWTVHRFDCCGGWMCSKCGTERLSKTKNERVDAMFHNKCPFCRQILLKENAYKTIGKKMLEHSNKGKAWAYCKIGFWHLSDEGKKFGFSFNKEKGLQLLKQAVDQRDSDALVAMVKLYSGEYGIFEHDLSKFMYYAKEAADLGNPEAQQALAFAYLSRQQHEDKGQHIHYITLAASQDSSKAYGLLGQYFKNGECGLTKSTILALHYFEKSSENATNNGEQLFSYSLALHEHIHNRYEGIMHIPGHSPIPKILYSACKAMEEGPDTPEKRDLLMRTISGYGNMEKSHCANCWKFSEPGSSFKRCVRCSGAWYCGKQCQVAHWKAGHKIDCIKKNW